MRNLALRPFTELKQSAAMMRRGLPCTRAHWERQGMAMGLSEAAAATGVNRSTIYRAWKAGRVSATRTEIGQIEIEPAELFRVFPPVAPQQGAQEAAHPHKMLDAMREGRDAWREQARKEGDERRELTQRLALAAPIATPRQPGVTPEVSNQRRPFLKRLKQRLVG
jgi:hypothetical protein